MNGIRKFGSAVLAASLLAVFAGAHSAVAEVQATTAPLSSAAETPLTSEVVPQFVSQEIVQPLPARDAEPTLPASDNPSSLRALVSQVPVEDTLSEEMHCLAGAVYFEARGEPLEGQLAVAQVIINRVGSGQFPANYCGVVYQRSQFSFVRGGRMPAIATGTEAWRKARAIAHIAHRGLWDSEVDDALYFHANYVRPSWSRKKVARATIDTHIFYR